MELILYGHDGCGLCDRLERLITPHLAGASRTLPQLIKRDITNDPDWQQRYGARIPVLVYNDRVILEGRPDPDHIEQVITKLR